MTCTAKGAGWQCDSTTIKAKGYCQPHYDQQRTGKPFAPLKRRVKVGATEKMCYGCKVVRPVSAFGEHAASPDGLRSQCRSCRGSDHRLNQYSLTRDEYDYLMLLQDDSCAICQQPFRNAKDTHIDHDHRCCSGPKSCGNCVRGAACQGCNARLIAVYETLPEELRTWDFLNEYLDSRPIENFRSMDVEMCEV